MVKWVVALIAEEVGQKGMVSSHPWRQRQI